MSASAFNRRAHPRGAEFSIWQASDGWPIRRLDWRQPSGARARGSLIFANGRGDFIEKYLEPLAHWHSAGWNVVAFDWRGQGESRGDIKGGHVDSFNPLVADCAGLIAEFGQTYPGPQVAIGHSMGGHLLLRVLAEHRPALAAAVLVAPMIGINTAPAPGWATQTLAQGMAMAGMSRVPAWSENFAPSPAGSTRQHILTSCEDRYADEIWWIQQQPRFALGPPSWGWLNAAYRSIALLTAERLKRVDVPVLFLATDRDRLVRADAIRQAARLVPRAELTMISEAAHEMLREKDSMRLEALDEIAAFLNEHAAA
jgi:lysophospholipase